MLTKIVELGCTVPGTFEPRVSLLDHDSITKTASNQLIRFWETLSPDEDTVYAHVLAMSAVEYYGPNNNGDAFYEADLRAEHPKFVKSAHIFLHHINKDPRKSIGKPIFAFYNEDMHRVELILKINRKDPRAARTVADLKAGKQLYVSMGVKVKYDVCSRCGNKAKTRAQYCDCLRYNMKSVLKDGSKVFAYNPAPLDFFDISFVGRPADKIAFVLTKMAGTGDNSDPISSAEMGELSVLSGANGEGLRKFADIVKYVDGQVVESKELPDAEVFNGVKDKLTRAIRWPVLPKALLKEEGITPAVFAASMLESGGPWSFSDFSMLLPRTPRISEYRPSELAHAASMMSTNPLTVEDIIAAIFKALLGSGLAVPKAPVARCSGIMAPVLGQRRSIMLKLGSQESDDKGSVAGMFVQNLSQRSLTGLGPGFHEELTVVGDDGKEYRTNRVSRMIAEDATAVSRAAKTSMAGLLALAALGAAMSGRGLERMVVPAALGAAAYGIVPMDDGSDVYYTTEEGVLVPKTTPMHEVAEKTAANAVHPSPTYLALDYLFSSRT